MTHLEFTSEPTPPNQLNTGLRTRHTRMQPKSPMCIYSSRFLFRRSENLWHPNARF